MLCSISLKNEVQEIDWNLDALRCEQNSVPMYDNIKRHLAKETNVIPKGLTAPITQFFVENDILYLRNISSYGLEQDKVCLPPSFINKALILAHNSPASGHGGVAHTMERLREFAYWPKIWKDTKHFIKSCETCAKEGGK